MAAATNPCRTCLTSLSPFFTAQKNPVSDKFKTHGVVNETAKAIGQFAEGAHIISQMAGADPKVVAGFERGHTWITGGRDMIALFSIFRVFIGALVEQLVLFGLLVASASTQKPAALKSDVKVYQYPEAADAKERALLAPVKWQENGEEQIGFVKYNDVAVTEAEKVATGIAKGAGIISTATFIFGMGFLNVGRTVDKHILKPIGHEMPAELQTAVSWFPYVMFGNHVSTLVQRIADGFYQTFAFDRVADAGYDVTREMYSEYKQKMKEDAIDGSKQILELNLDGFFLFGHAALPLVKAGLGFGIALLGMWYAFTKTD